MCPWSKSPDVPRTALVHLLVTNYSAQRGHLVGMFRDPDQRILSGYHDEANNFAAEDYGSYLVQAGGGNCTGFSVRGVRRRPLLDFAEAWKGGMTYQLVSADLIESGQILRRHTTAVDPKRAKVTQADGLEAAKRVQEGFAFVGIAEDWDLSICLFHKMFGGACHADEFQDTRPGRAGKSADQDYDISQLQGWHDDIDEVVYAAALDVFRRNLIMFDVSQETCQECYSVASYSHTRRD